MKFLGSSKVTQPLRISIVKEAAEAMDVKEGDHILFYKDDKGNILIRKG